MKLRHFLKFTYYICYIAYVISVPLIPSLDSKRELAISHNDATVDDSNRISSGSSSENLVRRAFESTPQGWTCMVMWRTVERKMQVYISYGMEVPPTISPELFNMPELSEYLSKQSTEHLRRILRVRFPDFVTVTKSYTKVWDDGRGLFSTELETRADLSDEDRQRFRELIIRYYQQAQVIVAWADLNGLESELRREAETQAQAQAQAQARARAQALAQTNLNIAAKAAYDHFNRNYRNPRAAGKPASEAVTKRARDGGEEESEGKKWAKELMSYGSCGRELDVRRYIRRIPDVDWDNLQSHSCPDWGVFSEP